MHVVPAREVDAQAVRACLELVERDPLTVPGEPTRDALAAVDVDGAVLGLGWRIEDEARVRVDVRVAPGRRRRGAGTALLAALTRGKGAVVVCCDASHPRVPRFLSRRGFELTGLVLHQRWDGPPTDVPGAFASAEVRLDDDHDEVRALLQRAVTQQWPALSTEAPGDSERFVRTAWLDAARVGLVAGHVAADALAVDAVAVLPSHRKRGIGRSLLVAAMREAAARELGVTLRVAQSDDAAQAWSRALGFWTYRSVAWYARSDDSAKD